MAERKPNGRIPVSLVTGFLGSGKTTLIRNLLTQPSMAGTAVIVNEFGAIGIDDAIFAEALDGGDKVLLLANGCLCCVAGDDLASAVYSLTRRETARPRRIIVETSGLADPGPSLRRMMTDPRVRGAVTLDALVATIDSVHGLATLRDEPISVRQAAVADRRVLTKTDIADPVTLTALEDRLSRLNPVATIIRASYGEVPADHLFGSTLVDRETGETNPDRWLGADAFSELPSWAGDRSARFSGEPAHSSSVGSWFIEETAPVNWAELSPRIGNLISRHGDRLLRLKGLIHTADDPRPLVIHGVQKVFHSPVRLAKWNRNPATGIVLIGDIGADGCVRELAEAVRDAARHDLGQRLASV